MWATPAIDLYYLLYIIASDETRLLHENTIIETYHREFVDALKKIGFMTETPSLLQLRIELLKNKFLEVVIATCFLPYVYVDSSKVEVFDEKKVDDRKAIFRQPKFVENIKRILPNLLTSGALD